VFPETTKEVGIDVGSRSFCTDSDGVIITNPKYLKQAQAELRVRQRRLSRRVKGSNRRKKARLLVAKAHERVVNQRRDFLHKTANYYIKNYKTICVEDLDIRAMGRDNKYANKSIADAGWGEFFTMLTYKAEEAGRTVVRVEPKGTSESCSRCQVSVPKSISKRIHRCPNCGLKMNRDLNAAHNILRVGQTHQALTKSDVGSCVA
jgi:putative transposase